MDVSGNRTLFARTQYISLKSQAEGLLDIIRRTCMISRLKSRAQFMQQVAGNIHELYLRASSGLLEYGDISWSPTPNESVQFLCVLSEAYRVSAWEGNLKCAEEAMFHASAILPNDVEVQQEMRLVEEWSRAIEAKRKMSS